MLIREQVGWWPVKKSKGRCIRVLVPLSMTVRCNPRLIPAMNRPCTHKTSIAPRSAWLGPLAVLLALWALASGNAASSAESSWQAAATVQQGSVAEFDFGESSEDLPAAVQYRVQTPVVVASGRPGETFDPCLSPLWYEQAPRAPPHFV